MCTLLVIPYSSVTKLVQLIKFAHHLMLWWQTVTVTRGNSQTADIAGGQYQGAQINLDQRKRTQGYTFSRSHMGKVLKPSFAAEEISTSPVRWTLGWQHRMVMWQGAGSKMCRATQKLTLKTNQEQRNIHAVGELPQDRDMKTSASMNSS